MDYYEIPENVLDHYILGCLKNQEEHRFKGTLQDGFNMGIDEGVDLVDGEEGLTQAMRTAIKGLKLKNPKFGIGNYRFPDKIDKKRIDYMKGYIRGLVDCLEIITFQDTRERIILPMQELGIA